MLIEKQDLYPENVSAVSNYWNINLICRAQSYFGEQKPTFFVVVFLIQKD